MPIKVEAKGSYHELVVFCDKVSRLPRIVNVLNTKLSTEGSDEKKKQGLKFTFDIITYRFKDKVGSVPSAPSSSDGAPNEQAPQNPQPGQAG